MRTPSGVVIVLRGFSGSAVTWALLSATPAACGGAAQQAPNDQTTVTVEKPSGSAAPAPSPSAPNK